MTVCKRVVFSGRVQGVGFRYTAFGLARSFDVSGTVRNRSDGRVEMVVQGVPEELDRFLKAIAGRMDGYISDQAVEDVAVADFQGFQIIR